MKNRKAFIRAAIKTAAALTAAALVSSYPAVSAEPDGEAVRLKPLSFTASSELEPYYSSVPPYSLYTYYASYIDDGDLSTAWNEGVPGDGTGEYLELGFPAGTVLTGGVIWPGFYETEELFYQNNAPVSLEISSGGTSAVVEMGEYASVWQAGFTGMPFQLEQEIVSDGTVRVTILGTRRGNTYDDTCITELYFTGRETAGENQGTEGQSGAADISGAEPGDIMTFGKSMTEQDAPMSWQVLAKDGNKRMLISRDVWSAPRYADSNSYPQWSGSNMRTWLNGEFLETAFSEEEQSRILDTAVTYRTMIQEDGTWGQETVSDKVFLLHADEAEMYLASDDLRKARPAEGVTGLEGIGEDGCAAWWLNDIGFESQGLAQVTAEGGIDTYGISVDNLLGVRPVLWIVDQADDAGGGTPEEGIPAGTTPEDVTTEENIPAGSIPENDIPAGSAPGDAAGNSFTEDDLQRIFKEHIAEPVLYFLYDDYDYDGTFEAMAVTEQPGGLYVHVWYVDSSGSITDLTGGRELYGYEFQDSANVRQRYLIDTGTQKFYIWENSAGGSGSTSFVFGVRAGIAYEPAVSGTIQSFQKEGEEYVRYGNDFSNGFHEYPRILMGFDAGSGEFYDL